MRTQKKKHVADGSCCPAPSAVEAKPTRPADFLPPTVEVCGRIVDNGFPCLGVLYRPQPEQLYCYQCGATADHEDPAKRARPVRYVRTDKMSEVL